MRRRKGGGGLSVGVLHLRRPPRLPRPCRVRPAAAAPLGRREGAKAASPCAPGRKVGGGPPGFVGDDAREQSCRGARAPVRAAWARAAEQGRANGDRMAPRRSSRARRRRPVRRHHHEPSGSRERAARRPSRGGAAAVPHARRGRCLVRELAAAAAARPGAARPRARRARGPLQLGRELQGPAAPSSGGRRPRGRGRRSAGAPGGGVRRRGGRAAPEPGAGGRPAAAVGPSTGPWPPPWARSRPSGGRGGKGGRGGWAEDGAAPSSVGPPRSRARRRPRA